MNFNISSYDIFPLEYYIEFLNINIRSHTRFGHPYPELSENLQKFVANISTKTGKKLIILNTTTINNRDAGLMINKIIF